MKFLLSMVMLSSLSAFASDLSLTEAIDTFSYELQSEPITGNQVKVIKRALFNELAPEAVKCEGTFAKTNVIGYFEDHILNKDTATLAVEKSNTTPKIVATLEDENFRFVFTFKTSPDFMKVLSVSILYQDVVTLEKNMGSLLNPSFEKVKEVKTTYETSCKK